MADFSSLRFCVYAKLFNGSHQSILSQVHFRTVNFSAHFPLLNNQKTILVHNKAYIAEKESYSGLFTDWNNKRTAQRKHLASVSLAQRLID